MPPIYSIKSTGRVRQAYIDLLNRVGSTAHTVQTHFTQKGLGR
jgi:hypothetical protein